MVPRCSSVALPLTDILLGRMVIAPSATTSWCRTGEILEPQLSDPTHRKWPVWLAFLAASRTRLRTQEQEEPSRQTGSSLPQWSKAGKRSAVLTYLSIIQNYHKHNSPSLLAWGRGQEMFRSEVCIQTVEKHSWSLSTLCPIVVNATDPQH